MTLCRHCRRPDRRVTRPRGLCWICYYRPDVIALYPSTSKYAAKGEGADDHTPVLEPRQPGEPPHRCLWCSRWRCQGPLRKCGECEAEYQRLAAGMPAEHGRT